MLLSLKGTVGTSCVPRLTESLISRLSEKIKNWFCEVHLKILKIGFLGGTKETTARTIPAPGTRYAPARKIARRKRIIDAAQQWSENPWWSENHCSIRDCLTWHIWHSYRLSKEQRIYNQYVLVPSVPFRLYRTILDHLYAIFLNPTYPILRHSWHSSMLVHSNNRIPNLDR